MELKVHTKYLDFMETEHGTENGKSKAFYMFNRPILLCEALVWWPVIEKNTHLCRLENIQRLAGIRIL